MKFRKTLFIIASILIFLSLSTIPVSAYTASDNLELRLLEETDDTNSLRVDLNYNFGLVDDIFDDITLTEFAYLDGVTSAIQTQLNAKQTLDADLTALGALAKTDSNFIVGDGTTWVAESGATARTSLGIDLSLYYLKTEINTLDKVETIYSADIVDTTELATALGDYYLKTAIDTLGEVEAIWVKDITDSDELASALADYYLKTAIDTQGEMETIWGVTLATDTELAALTYADVGAEQADAGLTSLAGLTYASPSFIKVTGNDTYAIRTIAETKTDLALSSDDLSDVASIAMLDENEDITGAWTVSTGSIEGVDATELGYLDGVTSDIQTQLNAKAATTALSDYYLKTAIDSLSEVETIWGADVTDSTELATALSDYYLKTAIDTIGEVETIWGLDVTTSTEMATYCETTQDYLKTSENSDSDDDISNDSIGTLSDVDLTDIANEKILQYNSTSEKWECETAGAGGASELSDLSDVGVTTKTDKFVLVADGDSFESRALVEADISDLGTTTAMVADKLSVFAATTSAELAGVISDEIGAGKARFDTSVTTKTTTATLTVAEAGTILVSAAGGAYTITLPTAVGNAGLTYHFIKTDANYTLITLDGDGTETFNYENSTGAPVLTYPRLNTYCAEVTVVSDNANWQVMNEILGQVPECKVSLGSDQLNLTNNVQLLVLYDTEVYDIGSNYDISTWESGTATSTSANHLVDTTATFTSAMVGVRVKNTTDTTETYITAFNSTTDVTVRDNIFVNTEAYEIKNSKFVCPIPGKYEIIAGIIWVWNSVVADKRYTLYVTKNGSSIGFGTCHSSMIQSVQPIVITLDDFSANDEIYCKAKSNSDVDTSDLFASDYTNIVIRLISKD